MNINKALRSILLIVSIIFMFGGITRGEMSKVYTKAVRICLECIGVG